MTLKIGVVHKGNDLSTQIVKSLTHMAQCGTFPIAEILEIPVGRLRADRNTSDWVNQAVYFVDNSIGYEAYTHFRTIINPQKRSKVILAVSEPSSIRDFLGLSICPNAVLYEPIIHRDIENILSTVQRDVDHADLKETRAVFILKNNGAYLSVLLSDIMFFESRGKQVALKTLGRELTFYSNFDDVSQQLSDHFIRCHKGFMINLQHVLKVDFKTMCITLRDQSVVPVSRSRKEAVKQRLAGKRHDE